MGGAKMSKSAGNVASYQDYVDVFGVDALRYFVMREMPLGLDASFSDEGVLTRFNSDLANDLGNLVSRTTTMIHRYRDGTVPESLMSDRSQLDVQLQRNLHNTIELVLRDFEQFQITMALQSVWELIRAVNKYSVEREPWALAKHADKRATLDATLYHSADALRVIAALIEPVMPQATERIRRMLGVAAESWTDLKPGTLAAGTRLGAVEPLFPRIEKTLEELRGMTTDNQQALAGAPAAPVEDLKISIDDFMKTELRVAKVLEAEAVPKSKKLIRMQVDVGEAAPRQILAGIAEAYQPEQLVGRTIVIVANLRPAKLMGLESNGMVLAASPDGGPPMLLAVEQGMPPGTRVR